MKTIPSLLARLGVLSALALVLLAGTAPAAVVSKGGALLPDSSAGFGQLSGAGQSAGSFLDEQGSARLVTLALSDAVLNEAHRERWAGAVSSDFALNEGYRERWALAATAEPVLMVSYRERWAAAVGADAALNTSWRERWAGALTASPALAEAYRERWAGVAATSFSPVPEPGVAASLAAAFAALVARRRRPGNPAA